MKKAPVTPSGAPGEDASPATARRGRRWVAVAACFVALAATAGLAGAGSVSPELVCSRGPSGQRFHVGVTMPERAEHGSTYAIRIDGTSSGKISHFGLNYIHDMTVDYLLPAGAYVAGSAQLVAGSGTTNVIAGSALTYENGVLRMALPGKVENGSSYTPPSIRFQLRAIEPPGSLPAVSLGNFRLAANAFLVGEVPVSCDPTPKPYPVGTTLITPPDGGSLP